MVQRGLSAEITRQSNENILRTILTLNMQQGQANAGEIAEALGIGLSTTYAAVKKLVESGYIEPLRARSRGRTAQKQSLVLTEAGIELAKELYRKHETLQKWLMRLGMDAEAADQDACALEHGISQRMMEVLSNHVSMALGTVGSGATMPENMRRLAEKMRQSEQDMAETISEKVHLTLERFGGTAGIERKCGLVARAGGEDTLEELLDVVENTGGITRFTYEQVGQKEAQALIQKHGGARSVARLLEELEAAGGVERLEQLKRLEQRAGGEAALNRLIAAEKQLGGPEALLRTAETARQFGGVEPMLDYAEQSIALARAYSTGKKNSNKMTDG